MRIIADLMQSAYAVLTPLALVEQFRDGCR